MGIVHLVHVKELVYCIVAGLELLSCCSYMPNSVYATVDFDRLELAIRTLAQCLYEERTNDA